MIRNYWVILCCVLLTGMKAEAQINHEILNRPDSLNLIERLSVSTNMVEWSTLQPNISVEYDLNKYTYNHWSVGLKVKGNFQTTHPYVPAQVFNITEVRAEGRYYWRTRLVDDKYYPKNTKIYKKLLSCRRDSIKDAEHPLFLKHPNTTYYRGFYVSHTNYSVLLSKKGRQGSAFGAGFLYGVVKPLYQFANGNALDLDLGISGGLYFTEYEEYEHDRNNNCYRFLQKKNWHVMPYPMLNEVRLGLVYRFTETVKHQLPERYRWRYDISKEYRDTVEARYNREKARQEKIAKDKRNFGSLEDYFNSIFDDAYPEALKKAKDDAEEKAKEKAQSENKDKKADKKNKEADKKDKKAKKEDKKSKKKDKKSKNDESKNQNNESQNPQSDSGENPEKKGGEQ